MASPAPQNPSSLQIPRIIDIFSQKTQPRNALLMRFHAMNDP
jgi:hypothetical protein